MRRIGTLNGRAVVQGDPNIVKPNEILLQNKEGKISLSKRSEQGELSTITGGGDKEDEDTIIIKGGDYYWKMDDPRGQDAKKYKKYQELLSLLSDKGCVFSLIYIQSYSSGVAYRKGISAAAMAGSESTNPMPSYVYNYIAYIRECSGVTYQGLKADSLVDLLIKLGDASNEQEAIEYLASLGLTKVTKEEFEEYRQYAIEM